MSMTTVKWDATNGGRDRVKAIPSDRVTEYLSYGWLLIEDEKPSIVDNSMAVEELVPVVPKKRGRPRR